MNDDPKTDFTDPKQVKACFNDLWDELDNLSGRITNAQTDNEALQIALLAVLTALDDKLPAVRDIVIHTLDEHRENHQAPTGPKEYFESLDNSLVELASLIEGANKLVERE